MSSSDSDLGTTSILSAIARSADAVIKSQQSDAKGVSSRKRKSCEDDGESTGLDHLQLRLRKALDDRLERDILPCFKKKKKRKSSGEASGENEANGHAHDLGMRGNGKEVRLFGKVPVGTSVILETQSSLRERAEYAEIQKQRANKGCRGRGSSASSSEDEAMKESLKILAVESNYILKNAEIAREKAAKNVVEAEAVEGRGIDSKGEALGPTNGHADIQDQAAEEKRRKKRIKEKKRKKRKKEEKLSSEVHSEPG